MTFEMRGLEPRLSDHSDLVDEVAQSVAIVPEATAYRNLRLASSIRNSGCPVSLLRRTIKPRSHHQTVAISASHANHGRFKLHARCLSGLSATRRDRAG